MRESFSERCVNEDKINRNAMRNYESSAANKGVNYETTDFTAFNNHNH